MRKVKIRDLTKPVYTKIPPLPLPQAWGFNIKPYVPPTTTLPLVYQYAEYKNITSLTYDDLAQYCKNSPTKEFSAVLMDPPWATYNSPNNGTLTVEEFVSCMFTLRIEILDKLQLYFEILYECQTIKKHSFRNFEKKCRIHI